MHVGKDVLKKKKKFFWIFSPIIPKWKVFQNIKLKKKEQEQEKEEEEEGIIFVQFHVFESSQPVKKRG